MLRLDFLSKIVASCRIQDACFHAWSGQRYEKTRKVMAKENSAAHARPMLSSERCYYRKVACIPLSVEKKTRTKAKQFPDSRGL